MSRTDLTRLFEGSEGRDLEFVARPNSQGSHPTLEAYGEWQLAFNYFNDRLFDGELPNTLITLTRRHGALGYFCERAFQNRDGAIAHEIAMNPAWFQQQGDASTFSTLVHEMCHCWRFVYGQRNRKGGFGSPGYHDARWADKMVSIGLMPSDTGKPGGRRTGYHMSDYVIEGGAFDLACREWLISGNGVNWRDHRPTADEAPSPVFVPDGDVGGRANAPRNTRARFICPNRHEKVWARPSAKLKCGWCDAWMERS